MANLENLKPWKLGQSGNPAGKPKGTKHLSTWIQELMEDESFSCKLSDGSMINEVPVKAIVGTLITRAVRGNVRAFDLLAKYGYGTKLDLTSKDKQIPFPILGGVSNAEFGYAKVNKRRRRATEGKDHAKLLSKCVKDSSPYSESKGSQR